MVGLDLERAPRLLDRELGPAGEPEHLAEIGVEQRDLRRELDRPLHVLDRLAQFAVLVRDHPEQVFGLRHVRLRLENLAADRSASISRPSPRQRSAYTSASPIGMNAACLCPVVGFMRSGS